MKQKPTKSEAAKRLADAVAKIQRIKRDTVSGERNELALKLAANELDKAEIQYSLAK